MQRGLIELSAVSWTGLVHVFMPTVQGNPVSLPGRCEVLPPSILAQCDLGPLDGRLIAAVDHKARVDM
jgi:hypothetical protein